MAESRAMAVASRWARIVAMRGIRVVEVVWSFAILSVMVWVRASRWQASREAWRVCRCCLVSNVLAEVWREWKRCLLWVYCSEGGAHASRAGCRWVVGSQ